MIHIVCLECIVAVVESDYIKQSKVESAENLVGASNQSKWTKGSILR